MRTSALGLVLAFLVVGCSKNEVSKNDQPSQTAAVAADNRAATFEIVTTRQRLRAISLKARRTGQFHKTSGRLL